MLRNLVTERLPPKNRIAKTDGEYEHHLTEPAVMLAYTFYLFEVHRGLRKVEIHPDGEHGKQFDIRAWLEGEGFRHTKPEGSTKYGGYYSDGWREVYVSLKPGLGDVVALTENGLVVAECKGGVLNTKHPGQKSRLRRGLCEAVGLLMTRSPDEEFHYAVVPKTSVTESLGARLKSRCNNAGIDILLVEHTGKVSSICT